MQTAAEGWILAGGAHHTVLSYTLTAQHMRDFAKMMEIEFVHVDKDTDLIKLEKELMYNDFLWKFKV